MDFLRNFIKTNSELASRMATAEDFDANLDNMTTDMPIYDKYNRGLALTANTNPRANLQLDTRTLQRCGLTGAIPSVEQALITGKGMPQPRKLVVDMTGMMDPDMEQKQKSKLMPK